MAEYLLVWIPTGFDLDDESKTDSYSRAALEMAVGRYRKLKEQCHNVTLCIPRSVVRSMNTGNTLWQIMYKEIRQLYGGDINIYVTATETTGSPTDGLAIARCVKDLPFHVEIFTVSSQMAAYLHVMYLAVARYILKCDLRIEMKYADVGSGWRHRQVYRVIRMVTTLAARHGSMFRLWYAFLNRVYDKRKHGFQQV